MIKRTTNREQMIPLWQEAFGDSEEDINFFLDNAHYRCFGYYEGEALASMLFLVPCKAGDIAAQYIYAACTAKAYKKRYFMTRLIEYCKKNNSALCLIPASDTLAVFYQKRGFTAKTPMESLAFDEIQEIKEYLFEGYHLTEPTALLYKGE